MINENSTKQKYNLFKDIKKYSVEHLTLAEQFENLLSAMNPASSNKKEIININKIKSMVESFQSYILETNVPLLNAEKVKLGLIASSSLSIAIKRRMLEDFFHNTKKRIEKEKTAIIEDSEYKKDIQKLQKNENNIFNWFILIFFAFKYDSITPFTHRLKNKTLFKIKVSLYQKCQKVIETIRKSLDDDYYSYSILEYNVLIYFIKLYEAIKKFTAITNENSYDPEILKTTFNNFTELFITLLVNKELALKAFVKIFKNKKNTHGFIGIVNDILDQPLFNNKPITYTTQDIYNKTTTGVLFSYYSILHGCIIDSINQIIFILKIQPIIPHEKKLLTDIALEKEKKQQNTRSEQEDKILIKFNELERITDKYIPNGKILEEYIYKAEPEYVYNLWKKENKQKPLSRIKRLVEGYIKYFIDYIHYKRKVLFMYDKKEFAVFDDFPELVSLSKSYNQHELGLAGSKVKDFLSLTSLEKYSSDEYILYLKNDINKNKLSATESFARDTIILISEKTYQISRLLNEIISNYYKSSTNETIENIKSSYDFFYNATLKKTIGIKTPLLLKKENLTFKEFLENACSLGYFILYELGHTIIDAIIKEKTDIQNNYSNLFTPEQNELVELENQIHSLYTDSATGLKNNLYFEDELLPVYYDEKNKYKHNSERYIFAASMDDMDSLNEYYGPDVVDELLKTSVQIFKNHIFQIQSPETNDIYRHKEGKIIGFINEINFSETLELLDIINQGIKNIEHSAIAGDEHATFSFGLYSEKQGTSVFDNTDVALALLKEAKLKGGGTICFFKDQNKIARKGEFSNSKGFNKDLISFLHR